MAQTYWVIEHRTRGCFVGFDYGPTTGEWGPRFRWSIPRSDPDVASFFTEGAARRELTKITVHVKGCTLFQMKG